MSHVTEVEVLFAEREFTLMVFSYEGVLQLAQIELIQVY